MTSTKDVTCSTIIIELENPLSHQQLMSILGALSSMEKVKDITVTNVHCSGAANEARDTH